MPFLLMMLLASCATIAPRVESKGRAVVPVPVESGGYSPASGMPFDSALHYTVTVQPDPSLPAGVPPNPRLVGGVLRVHVIRVRAASVCDTATIVSNGAEQSIDTAPFRSGDYLLFEHWEGFKIIIRGYDSAGAGRVENSLASYAESAHALIGGSVDCSP